MGGFDGYQFGKILPWCSVALAVHRVLDFHRPTDVDSVFQAIAVVHIFFRPPFQFPSSLNPLKTSLFRKKCCFDDLMRDKFVVYHVFADAMRYYFVAHNVFKDLMCY